MGKDSERARTLKRAGKIRAKVKRGGKLTAADQKTLELAAKFGGKRGPKPAMVNAQVSNPDESPAIPLSPDDTPTIPDRDPAAPIEERPAEAPAEPLQAPPAGPGGIADQIATLRGAAASAGHDAPGGDWEKKYGDGAGLGREMTCVAMAKGVCKGLSKMIDVIEENGGRSWIPRTDIEPQMDGTQMSVPPVFCAWVVFWNRVLPKHWQATAEMQIATTSAVVTMQAAYYVTKKKRGAVIDVPARPVVETEPAITREAAAAAPPSQPANGKPKKFSSHVS